MEPFETKSQGFGKYILKQTVAVGSSPSSEPDPAMWLLNYIVAWFSLTSVYFYDYFHTHGFIQVEIDKGSLRGRNASTWRGQTYFSFKGIPFAKPPVDELRFKAPREETAWEGVRDAIFPGEVCPQLDMLFGIFRGEEDCLFLNVYTSTLKAERLPVMVYIHGGMFMRGSGNDEFYGPDYFMEAGIVLVTINYRLGALGFLSTGDDNASENAGMKDQVAALKWVRRNIAKFGGDPENVSLFGGSTGAATVHYHLLSPMSSGLFTKAISQSGTALNTWALLENGTDVAVRLAEALGAKDEVESPARVLKFLKTVPYEDIVRVQETIMTPAESRIPIHFLFVPTVEKGVKSEEVFLPDLPSKLFKSGKFNKVPYITGYNDKEGHFFVHELERPEVMKLAVEDTERYVPTDIKKKGFRDELANSIRKFYFDDKPVGVGNISNFLNLYTDIIFSSEFKRATELHIKSTDIPIYFYVFSYDGSMNLIKYFYDIDRPGAAHGDELGYLFHHTLRYWSTPKNGSSDERVLNTMVRLWTNFAKYGNPTPPGDPLTWKPVTNEKFYYLNISGEETQLAENPDAERTEFWKKAYQRYDETFIDVQNSWEFEINV